MKSVYPVIFTPLHDVKDTILLEIPQPSMLSQIDPAKGTFSEEREGYVSWVDIDFTEYRCRIDNKTVRRNVTIPNWLNQEAEKAHLNASRVLQEALMSKLGVSR